MRLIVFIEQREVIEKILRLLGLWPMQAHRPSAGYPLPSSQQRVVAA
jgi:hypothetical protein